MNKSVPAHVTFALIVSDLFIPDMIWPLGCYRLFYSGMIVQLYCTCCIGVSQINEKKEEGNFRMIRMWISCLCLDYVSLFIFWFVRFEKWQNLGIVPKWQCPPPLGHIIKLCLWIFNFCRIGDQFLLKNKVFPCKNILLVYKGKSEKKRKMVPIFFLAMALLLFA